MELHTCLWNDVDAFNFLREDLEPLKSVSPSPEIVYHTSEDSFLASCSSAETLLTWEFRPEWYSRCPNLRQLLTPAAGTDWVSPDPTGKVNVVHGTFHGGILAESLLSAILFMNHRMPAMISNFQHRAWDRNIQTRSRLLSGQTVLIIGLGNIGRVCADVISGLGAKVIGVRRNPGAELNSGVEVYPIESLAGLLPIADHVVLLLPGEPATDGFMNVDRLRQCKPGSIIYNFGRGNALKSKDLVECWDQFDGAFLDVTDEEPLPPSSDLWQLENIMITPHSSCIYADYRQRFISEVIARLS